MQSRGVVEFGGFHNTLCRKQKKHGAPCRARRAFSLAIWLYGSAPPLTTLKIGFDHTANRLKLD